jgi:hypothetical protein
MLDEPTPGNSGKADVLFVAISVEVAAIALLASAVGLALSS